MKQFLRNRSLLLISILFTFALVQLGCGSGGGKAASSNGGNTGGGGGGSQPGPATSFTLKLIDSDQNLHAMGLKTSSFGTLPTPTDVRVVIRTFGTVTTHTLVCETDNFDNIIPSTCVDVPQTIFTETYRDIQDVPYSTSVTVGIPAGTGYQLDVITSQIQSGTTTSHNILRYGNLTNVDIVTGQSTSATIIMTPLSGILNMTVADVVTSNQNFIVTLNDALPIEPVYNMIMSFGTYTPSVVTSATNTCTFTAPAAYTAGTVGLQGQFTLNRSFLKTGELPVQWTRLFPIATYNEQVYSTLNPLIAVTLPGI